MVVQAVRRTRRPRRGSTPVLNCAEAVAPLLRTGADPNARVGASDGGPAAVDEEHMPGHVARGIGGKEEQPAVDLMQRGVRARSVCSPTDGAKPSSARKPVIVSILSPSSDASSSRRSPRRAVTSTFAPAWCNTRATRAPRPADAPVTNPTRPSSRHRTSDARSSGVDVSSAMCCARLSQRSGRSPGRPVDEAAMEGPRTSALTYPRSQARFREQAKAHAAPSVSTPAADARARARPT